MKTFMHVKTDGQSLFDEAKRDIQKKKPTASKNRLPVSKGAVGCAALIALLGASGYLGASRQEIQRMTAAPVISREIASEANEALTFEEASARHDAERAQELAILDGVIEDENADVETKRNAQAQKLQIAQRMEMEAGIEAALAHMGMDRAAAISGDGRIVLLLPASAVQNQEETARIVDAATSVSGCAAKDVKIILVKK